MTGRMDRYVLARFLGFYGLALLYLVGLYVVVDLVLHIDNFTDARKHLEAANLSLGTTVLEYYAAGLPLIVLQLAPFVTVMGACMAVVDLRRRNELYPMVSAGRSPARVLAPILAFSVVVTGLLAWAQDRLAPPVVAYRLRVERILQGEQDRSTQKVPHVRDGAGNAWSIQRYDPHVAVAEQVRVAPFVTRDRTYDLLAVPRMRWQEGPAGRGWYPEAGGVLLVPGDEPDGADASVPVPADRPLPTDLGPADVDLALAADDIEGLSRRGLARLRDRNPDLPYLGVLVHRRMTFPLANLVLLLVGVPIVLRSRGSSLFLSVLAAVAVCAAYFAWDTVACDLGGRGLLPAALATWSATVVFGAAGLTMLDAARGEA